MSDKEQKSANTVYVEQTPEGLVGKDKAGNVLWKQVLTPKQLQKLNSGKSVKESKRRKVRYVYALNSKKEKILVPAGFNLDRLPELEGDMGQKHVFNEVTAGNICLLMLEGYSLREITAMEGMPPLRTILTWLSSNEGFKKEFETAKRERGLYFADKVHEIAHTVTEGNSKSAKVAMDGMKWLASTANPDEYGSKTKITGDKNAPVAFIIDTGIRKYPAIEAQGGVIDVEPTED